MKSLKFNYLPDSSIKIKILANNINKYYEDFLDNNNTFINEFNENGLYFYKFDLIFRTCKKGEFYRKETSMFFN